MEPDDRSRSTVPPAAPANAGGTTRSVLRQALLQQRDAIDARQKMEFDRRIRQQVLGWLQRWLDQAAGRDGAGVPEDRAGNAAQPAFVLGVYWPIGSEPDLQPLYPLLAAHGIQLALPVVGARDAALRFARWTPGEPLQICHFGIAVPASTIWLQPQALLLPCVGFNAAGYRLGYGGGFYDRTLANTPRPHSAGIGYRIGHSQFAAQPHDIALDCIITEQGCFDRRPEPGR